MSDVITVNGKKYVPEVATGSGNRFVFVLDRGWVVAGDLTEVKGRLVLKRAVHVLRWESIGFDGMLREPKSSKVTIKKIDQDLNAPADSEIFRIPVTDDWGF